MNLLWDISAKTYESESQQRAALVLRRKATFPRTAPKPKLVHVRPDQDHHMAAWDVWQDMQAPTTSPSKFVKGLCYLAGIDPSMIKSRQMHRNWTAVKHRMIWDTHVRFPHLSLPQLGLVFGGMEHTSVLHALKKHGYKTKPRKAVTPEQMALMTKLIAEGLGPKVIAEKTGLSITTVRFHVYPETYAEHRRKNRERDCARRKKARAE